MGDKFAGGVAERLDEELNSLIQDYETIKEFADFLANSTPEQRQALLNKYGDAAKKLFTDSEYRGQVGDAIVEAFKEGITDDIEKFTRITSGDEKDIGYTTTHAALMSYGIWKRYGKKIGKEVVRAVDDDVAKNTVDSKNLKKAKDGVGEKGGMQISEAVLQKGNKFFNQYAKRNPFDQNIKQIGDFTEFSIKVPGRVEGSYTQWVKVLNQQGKRYVYIMIHLIKLENLYIGALRFQG